MLTNSRGKRKQIATPEQHDLISTNATEIRARNISSNVSLCMNKRFIRTHLPSIDIILHYHHFNEASPRHVHFPGVSDVARDVLADEILVRDASRS